MKILIFFLIIIAELLHYYLYKQTHKLVEPYWKAPVIWVVGRIAYACIYALVLYIFMYRLR